MITLDSKVRKWDDNVGKFVDLCVQFFQLKKSKWPPYPHFHLDKVNCICLSIMSMYLQEKNVMLCFILQ